MPLQHWVGFPVGYIIEGGLRALYVHLVSQVGYIWASLPVGYIKTRLPVGLEWGGFPVCYRVGVCQLAIENKRSYGQVMKF